MNHHFLAGYMRSAVAVLRAQFNSKVRCAPFIKLFITSSAHDQVVQLHLMFAP